MLLTIVTLQSENERPSTSQQLNLQTKKGTRDIATFFAPRPAGVPDQPLPCCRTKPFTLLLYLS